MNKDIIEIIKIDNVRVENTHNGVSYPPQSILKVIYRDNTYRILDLVSQKDITDIDYFKINETDKTKTKTLFIELD
jgi:hypothetical protein